MLTKTLLSGITTTLLAASLYGCSGGSALETPNTGTETNDGLISQKNFSLLFSELAPAFIKLPTTSSGSATFDEVTSDVTVRIGDNNNQVITAEKTILFQTEWGVIEPSCQTNSEGSCTVEWRSGSPNDMPSNFRNTIVAYSSTPDIGQESFLDLNGNGRFDDGDTFTDFDEPFIDNDESGAFNAGDKIIDTINGVDITGTNEKHDGGDGFYNGPDCSHSSLCSTVRTVSTVWASGSLLLTGTDTFTIGGNTQNLVGTVTLQNNGGDNLPVNVANGAFTFATSLTPGQNYSVTILTQPVPETPGDPVITCTVINGDGQVAGTVTTVVIDCVAAP